MSYRNAIIFLLGLFFTVQACAKDGYDPSLAELWLSKSVGVWEKGREYGYFKVQVYRIGLEHAADKVKVIVTFADTKNNKQKIKLEKWIDSPGYKGYIDNIDLKILKPDKLILGLDVEMKGMDGVVMREIYIIDSNGSTKNVTKAEYIDIY